MNSIQSLCINVNLDNLVNNVISSAVSYIFVALMSFILCFLGLDRIKQYLLSKSSKIPYVEFNLDNHYVRNIGLESATDIQLFKIDFSLDNNFDYIQLKHIDSLPNLIKNQKEDIQYIPDDCLTVHEYCFLLQYSNISGMYFWTLIIPTSPRGDNFIQINPHFIKDKDKLNIASNKCKCPRWIKSALLKDKKKYYC
ncbi:hypothetical protein [Gardnerella vaginalis]|uniref:hypothetical protein n=1 Tax=Gardnerella vaginalis TaxID=2702 RepID=UPI001F0BAADC|nr:hypothetical protein [Gardnerella vaginalis]